MFVESVAIVSDSGMAAVVVVVVGVAVVGRMIERSIDNRFTHRRVDGLL